MSLRGRGSTICWLLRHREMFPLALQFGHPQDQIRCVSVVSPLGSDGRGGRKRQVRDVQDDERLRRDRLFGEFVERGILEVPEYVGGVIVNLIRTSQVIV